MIDLRRAATGVLAAGLIAFGAVAAPASAAGAPAPTASAHYTDQGTGTVQPNSGNSGNSGGTVYDPSGNRVYGTSANGDKWQCPYESFCVWTGTGYSGTMFALPKCGEYDIYNWLGYGSWANDQTPGTQAHLYGSNYSYWAPGSYWQNGVYYMWSFGNQNFYPVDHIRPC
jgi:hypothetical protein